MTKKVPYEYYKMVLLVVWALAILCIVGTWVGFAIANKASVAFAATVDSFLSLALIALVVLLALNERQDYKKRAILFGILTFLHILFFVLVLSLAKNMTEGDYALYALPGIHTVLLVSLSIVGIYFWIRNRFKFKSFAQQDAIAAFGGPVEEPKVPEPQQPSLEPEEPKKARDEKTGIVSL